MTRRVTLARRRPPGPAPEAVPFQDPLEAVIAEPPPPLLRGVHWLVAALFAALIGIAAVAQVDVVVTGAGRLAPDAPPIVLQPMERAVIREIRVRPGEAVRQGDVLALLDPSFAEADRAALAAQRATLAATLARLEAELAGLPAPDAPDPDTRLQAGLQAQREAVVATRLRAFDEEMQGRPLDSYSGGWKMRVALARILLMRPDVLLLDDPKLMRPARSEGLLFFPWKRRT